MTNFRQYLYAASLISLVSAGACVNGPAQPSGEASVATPRLVQPASAAQIPFASQPVSLVVNNAVVSQATGAAYTFEVAADAAFAAKVATKSGVVAGASGQTSVQLDALPSGTYYWHARVEQGGTDGLFSSPFTFVIGPQITIGAPVLVAPASGAATQGWPVFRVNNSTRSGAVGSLAYRFEVASSAAFSSIILSSTVAETFGQTSYVPAPRVAPPVQTLFWRVTPIDQFNNVSGPASAVQAFTPYNTNQSDLAILLGLVLWPGVQPPGTLGHATMGGAGEFGAGWGIQSLYYAPLNVVFPSPDIEMLRYFDLWDRGFRPEDVVAWMNANGYPSNALWYPGPEKAVLGMQYVYIAARNKVITNATWDVVVRVE